MAYQSRRLEPTQKERIFEFICANPLCIASDMQKHFGFEAINISMCLYRLRREGAIVSLKINGTRRVQWLETDQAAGESKPEQRVVQNWTGHKRDEWHKLFYGEGA